MTEYHVGNYTYLYCLQWIKNDYRLTVPLPLWAENFYHLDAEFYLLRSGVGVGPLSRFVKMYPDSQHSCSHPSQAHSCFQAFVNDTGRPWRPQTSLVSKTESKSTVLFPPVFLFLPQKNCFFVTWILFFLQVKMSTNSTSHGQVSLRSVLCPSVLRMLHVCGKKKSPPSDSPAKSPSFLSGTSR